MATKQPKKYKTGADTLLGKLFRGLAAGTGDNIAPKGARPVLPDVSGISGIDPAELEKSFGIYGSKSNSYGLLNEANPELAKQYAQIFADRRGYDNAMNAFNATDQARAAMESGEMDMSQMGTMLKDYWGAQPFLGKAAGAGLALGNIGGLVDNDKFGGQLGGLALGGLGSKMLMSSGAITNPGVAALLTMGGGELGALFDKLRAKREQQRQQIARR